MRSGTRPRSHFLDGTIRKVKVSGRSLEILREVLESTVSWPDGDHPQERARREKKLHKLEQQGLVSRPDGDWVITPEGERYLIEFERIERILTAAEARRARFDWPPDS